MSVADAEGDEEEAPEDQTFSASDALELIWPSDEQITSFIGGLKQLQTPSHGDIVVKKIILEETLPYFLGDKDLAQTMEALKANSDMDKLAAATVIVAAAILVLILLLRRALDGAKEQ